MSNRESFNDDRYRKIDRLPQVGEKLFYLEEDGSLTEYLVVPYQGWSAPPSSPGYEANYINYNIIGIRNAKTDTQIIARFGDIRSSRSIEYNSWLYVEADKDDARREFYVENFGQFLSDATKQEFRGLEKLAMLKALKTCNLTALPEPREDFDRASGAGICEVCSVPYIDHPADWRIVSDQHRAFLNILCDGRLVKL